MKTNFLMTLVAIGLSNFLQAQENMVKKDFSVNIRTSEAITMLYYEHKGPYYETFNKFGQLMAYIQQNSIATGAISVGVYYDNPATVAPELLRSEAGYSIIKPVMESGMFKCKTIQGGKAVCVRYKSMDEISPAYEALGKYISDNQLKTVPYSVEIYYGNDPSIIDAEILMLLAD